jgi:hypothetical protein
MPPSDMEVETGVTKLLPLRRRKSAFCIHTVHMWFRVFLINFFVAVRKLRRHRTGHSHLCRLVSGESRN